MWKRAHTWDFIVQFDDVSLVSWFISTFFHNERILSFCHSSNFRFGGLWCPFPKTNDTMCRIFMHALLPACLLMLALCVDTLNWYEFYVWHTYIHMVPFIRFLYFYFMCSFLLSIRRLWPNTRYLLKREENTSNFKDNVESYMCTHYTFLFSIVVLSCSTKIANENRMLS